MKDITEERLERIKSAAFQRQLDLTIILENVHDPHNIGAVLRSCDAAGIREIYVLFTEKHLDMERIKMGKRTSAGTRKWVEVHYFRDPELCLNTVRKQYGRVLCAMPSEQSKNMWDIDFTPPTALLLGNERDGVSDESRKLCDGEYFIPMAGMAKSLNISVACALSVYEVYRQRSLKGSYQTELNLQNPTSVDLFDQYLQKHYHPNLIEPNPDKL